MRGKKGSISIEAALTLPIFIFLLLALTNYFKLMIVYDNVNSGINSSVKIISKYSYLASATGLDEYAKIANKDPKESMNDWIKVTGIFGDGDISSMEDAVKNFDASKVTPSALKDMFESEDFQSASMALVMTMLNHGLAGGGYDTFLDQILSEGLKGFAKSGLKNTFLAGKDDSKYDEVMKTYGIKKQGKDYFDFDGTLCRLGSSDNQITVVANYTYTFKFFNIKVEIPISQRVSVVPWVGNDA